LFAGIIMSTSDLMMGTPHPLDTSFLNPILYFVGALYLLNIIYPVIVSFLVRKNSQRRYYFPLIRFIR
jgi:hypothetical protein